MGQTTDIIYRLGMAWRVLIGAIAGVVVTIVATVFDPRLLPFLAFVVAAAWVAIVVWVLPQVRVRADGIVVTNPFRIGTIPYAAMTSVTGGESFIVKTENGSIRASAGGGTGGSPTMLRVDANQTIVGPLGANRLDVNRGEGDTPATRIARTVRRRIETMTPLARGAEQPRPHFQPNWFTLAGTIVMALVTWGVAARPLA